MDQQIEVSPQTSEAYARFGLYAHPFDDRPEKATAKAFITNGKNMSDDVVITEIHVEFEFHDVTGKPYRKHAVMQTWIEPSWDLEGEVSATGFMFPEDLSVKHVNEYQCRGTQNYLCKGGKIMGYRGLKSE